MTSLHGNFARKLARWQANRQRRQSRQQPLPPRGIVQKETHGTRSCYVLTGCRCAACSAANRDYGRHHKREARMPWPKEREPRSLTLDSIELLRREVWPYCNVAVAARGGV